MTFTEFESFKEWLLEDVDEIDVQEINLPGEPQYVTIESIRDSPSLNVAEVIITAHDSGFHIGTFFADRYDGELTFRP